MEDLVIALENTVKANGNEMGWNALMETVDFKQRRLVPDALKIARKKGTLTKYQAYSPETGLTPLTVRFIGEGSPFTIPPQAE